MRLFAALVIIAALQVSAGCTARPNDLSSADTLARYYDAADHESVAAALAPDYRIWFGEKRGPGMSREEALAMLEWDLSLHPVHEHRIVHVEGDTVIAITHEQNDFSRLIDFPGWTAASLYRFDDAGRLAEQVYVPAPNQPRWQPYLDAALPWLREHRGEALARIYPDGRLNQSVNAAREWVAVLRDWRAATGRSTIE